MNYSKSLFILLGLLAVSAPLTVSGNSLRTRRALDGGRCWDGWCRNGKTDGWFGWGWGVNCNCDDGWTGTCCTELETCSADSKHVCQFSRLQEKSIQCKDVLANNALRLGDDASLPAQLKGIFWLQGQGDSSALTSFSRSNDGGGLNQGQLSCSSCNANGDNVNHEANIKARVGGDRMWSFNDKASSWVLVEALDLVYNFHFDNIKDPKRCDIIPESRNLGIKLKGKVAEWLLNFDMELMEEKDKPAEYKNVVMWARPSQIAGIEGGYYELVQVIDGEGDKTAAFDKFVAYCEDDTKTGSTPGKMWYREITN